MAASHAVDDGRKKARPAPATPKLAPLQEIGTRAAGLIVNEIKSHTTLSPQISLILEGLGHLMERVIAISADPQKVALVSRAVKGLDVAINAPMSDLDSANILSASTDVGALARALTAAASDPAVSKLDPNAELIAAGAARKAELIGMAGGLYALQDVASILKITRQAIEKRRKAGTIIAVRTGDDYRYPACQFAPDGMIEGLDDVLRAMPIRSDWMRLEWLLTPDEALEGMSPLATLKAGRSRDVMEVARAHGAE